MENHKQLHDLRDRALEEMDLARKAAHMDEVIRYARIVQELDSTLASSKATVERISAELDQSSKAGAAGGLPGLDSITSAHGPSRKARGKSCRDEYLRTLGSKGVALRRLAARIYQTGSGKRVGIAYAGEVHPDKWWMGLPDEQYDILVFLCKTSSGETLDFVLSPDFVRRVWNSLTLSNGQREWHVVRTGVNFELEPKKGLGQINQYRSRTEFLR